MTGIKLEKKNFKQLKKILDDTFEYYVRVRDNWTCIICGVYIPNNKKEMHAGHFIDRGITATRWHEKNVNAQCAIDNAREHFSKNKVPYTLKMIEKYGAGILEELDAESKKPVGKINKSYFIERIYFYQNKLKELWGELL